MSFQDREWTPLADTFVASNGLSVEFLRSSAELNALGKRLENALSDPRFTDRWAKLAEAGHEQIYQVTKDGEVLSCGEVYATGGKAVVTWNRARQNRPGSPESEAAVAEFIEGVNDGTVEANLAIGVSGFEPKAAARAP